MKVLVVLLVAVAVGVHTAELHSRVLDVIAIGSCNRHDEDQSIWHRVIDEHPDLFVWLGDIVYNDNKVGNYPLINERWVRSDLSEVHRRYTLQKESKPYAFLRALHNGTMVIGVWDDHDYGLDNGDRTAPRHVKLAMKGELLSFLDERASSERRQRDGAYAAYTYGKGNRLVKIILLDNRWFRDPLSVPIRERQLFGAEQWAWLERELRDSKQRDVSFTIIGMGTQILPRVKYYAELMSAYPKERERLFNLFAEVALGGIVLTSGDIHYAEFLQSCSHAVGYPLYEMTTSGLTHSLITALPYNLAISKPFLYKNYGIFRIDWSADDPILSMETHDEHGNIITAVHVSRSALQPGVWDRPDTPPGAKCFRVHEEDEFVWEWLLGWPYMYSKSAVVLLVLFGPPIAIIWFIGSALSRCLRPLSLWVRGGGRKSTPVRKTD